MKTKLFSLFFAFLIMFSPLASCATVDANIFTPTDFITMKIVLDSPTELQNKIRVAGDTSTVSTSLDNGRISISDSIHTFREVSMDYQMLLNELDGFNGKQVLLTHINDAGVIDSRRVVSVSPDVNGYVSVIMMFSTTVVDGFTGTTTTTHTSQSGNQSFSVPDGSSYDINITDNQLGMWELNGRTYENKTIATINGSVVTTETDIPLQAYIEMIGNNGSDIAVSVGGIEVPKEVESNNDVGYNVSTFYKMNTTADENTEVTFYHGNAALTEPATDSTYGSEAVWGGWDDVWLMADLTTSTIKNSAGGTDMSKKGANEPIEANGAYGKVQDFDGTNDFILGTMVAAIGTGDYTLFARTKTEGTPMRLLADNADAFLFPVITYRTATNTVGIQRSPDGDYQMPHTASVVYDTTVVSRSSGTVLGWTGGSPQSLTPGGSGYDQNGHDFTSTDFWMNRFLYSGTNYYSPALIDQIRIKRGATFSDGYIATSHTNLDNPTATGTAPFYLSIGEPQQTSGTANITASITGDSNTQSYNTSQSRAFTLTPTATTNNVVINTTSTDYDITITTYWTEDTVKTSESVSNGVANITIEYTPSHNITAGVINATYELIDFAAHDYTGALSVWVDGVDYSSNGTRLLNAVNTTIVNFDKSTHYINFSVPYNPKLDLYAPNDTATLEYPYPPLTHDVVLTWQNTTGIYKYTVTDYDTGAILSTDTVYTNTSTVPLSSGKYKWYVRGYDDVFKTYSPISDIRSFTVKDVYSYDGTVVHGVAFEYISGVKTPIDTALVNIWNDTWSDSQMVGANGYFVFKALHNSTYSMRATKDGYIASNIELVTPAFNTTLTRNILLQSSSGAGQQYVDHYVQFTLKSLFGTRYSGVTTNVYLGGAVVALYTGTTGTDGSISFELNENQKYRITFVDASQGINREVTLYPIKNEYTIIVFGANLIPDAPATNDILFSAYGQSINLTHGYINVSFNDTSVTTTLAELWINDTNVTNLYYFNTTDDVKAWSQVVPGGNASYVVTFKLTNTELDEPLIITRNIKFNDAVKYSLGFDSGWKYQLVAVVIISVIALLGSVLNAEKMAVITVLVAWFMVFLGWLNAGASIPEQITLGLMLLFATLISFGAVIRKGDST